MAQAEQGRIVAVPSDTGRVDFVVDVDGQEVRVCRPRQPRRQPTAPADRASRGASRPRQPTALADRASHKSKRPSREGIASPAGVRSMRKPRYLAILATRSSTLQE